MPWRRIWGLEV